MIQTGRFRTKKTESLVNMSPLIDLVFLLLIFFMVTSSFVKETGVDVDRPSANSAKNNKNSSVLVGISRDGKVFFDGKQIDVRSVKKHVKNSLADSGATSVIVVADKLTPTGSVIKVMDQARMAGAKNVSLAASLPGKH
jgi:biopolymer transport protein ExbD